MNLDYQQVKEYLLTCSFEYADLDDEQFDRLINYSLKKCTDEEISKIKDAMNLEILPVILPVWVKSIFWYNWKLEQRIDIRMFIETFESNSWQQVKRKIKLNKTNETNTIFSRNKKEIDNIEYFLIQQDLISEIKNSYTLEFNFKYSKNIEILSLLKESFKYTKINYTLLYDILNTEKLKVFLIKKNGFIFISVRSFYKQNENKYFNIHLPHHRKPSKHSFKNKKEIDSYLKNNTNFIKNLQKVKIPVFYKDVELGLIRSVYHQPFSGYNCFIEQKEESLTLLTKHHYNGVDGTNIFDAWDEEINTECEVYKINGLDNEIMIVSFPFDRHLTKYYFTTINDELMKKRNSLLNYVKGHFLGDDI